MADIDNKEKEILAFWKKADIYQKSKKKNKGGEKFYMMDGPPYATGSIHLGTALNKTLKDIAMRSKRLQGYEVFDRPGYDTHGTPIELQIEKEINSGSKKDIEKYGVENFIKKCKEYATRYIGVMNEQFENLGVWMDWENPYLTLSDDYIQAIWHAFKEANKKGLLYLGQYPVHICSRCETVVAYNEIEYQKKKDLSIYVKFPVKDKKNTFLIIWTTTPWTLPGNTGVMVNPDVEYQEVETSEGEIWIIAKPLVAPLMSKLERSFTIKKTFKGKELEGWKYENPLAKNIKVKVKKGYEVILSARYVTTEDGTGLVHCAPGHGKEDYEVGKEYGLDMPSPVSISGIMSEEAGKYAGKKALDANKEIVEDLESEGFLVYKMYYDHDYPMCWRDKTPLLMMSQPQWFLKISEIHKKLLKENEKVNWIPDWMQLRMKAWLDGISDWPVSRQRNWGTPLPIWVAEDGDIIVVGSLEELEKLSGKKVKDVHKPGIDQIIIEKKGKKYRRVPEVLDVWFDSGVSSWAALGYPAKTQEFKKFWPADLNIEGKDQIRGWWNSQLILSQIAFDKKPFENIMVHGMIVDMGKKKMSKSLGNITSPEEIIEKYGRDAMRYYFAMSSKGEDFAFDENSIGDVQKTFMMLNNVNNFVNQLPREKQKTEAEDKWISSKFNSLVNEVPESYNNYKYPEVIQKLESFLVQDLSRSYIKIVRDRSGETYELLNEIRTGLLKMLAPICPFLAESIWQSLKNEKVVKEESIHLSDWPKADKKRINKELEKDFEIVMKLIELGLYERDKAKIGLRWPLASAAVNPEINKDLQEILARQLNVKKIIAKNGKEISVSLDINMTPELEAEGYSREIARKVQAERKNAGLQKGDLVILYIDCDKELQGMLEKNKKFLMDRTNAKELHFGGDKISDEQIVFTVREKKITISFRHSPGTSV